jgi:Family of unknown function (DUF6529)
LSSRKQARQVEAVARQRAGLWFGGTLVVGAVVAVALGTYGRLHDPTFESITTFGFATQTDMKVWLGTVATAFGLVQLITALRMYGRLGTSTPSPTITTTHRVSGVLAVVVSLPVAYHCLWSLGFQDYSNRVLAHSLMGCAFYGVFVTKMLALRIQGLPGWVLPVLGGATFTLLIGVVVLSAGWFFVADTGSPTYGS